MTSAQYNGLVAAIGAIVQSPTGTIILYGSITPPSGYLPCDGASLLRATYPALFAVIGVSFGSADGTHFNAPDLRSRLPMGVGAGPGLTVRTLADQGGAEGAAVAKANLAAFALNVTDPGHVHTTTVTDPTHSHGSTDGGQIVTNASGNEYVNVAAGTGNHIASTTSVATGISVGADSNTTGISVASGGSGTALPTVDPFTTVAYMIKT